LTAQQGLSWQQLDVSCSFTWTLVHQSDLVEQHALWDLQAMLEKLKASGAGNAGPPGAGGAGGFNAAGDCQCD